MYLGYTTKLGYLDKGGKWRKKNWWTKDTSVNDRSANNIADEIRKA